MKTLAFVEATVFDRDGKIIAHKKKRSRSFVRAFNHVLCAQIRQEVTPDPVIQTLDITNVLRSLRTSSGPFSANGAAGDATNGIVVGTDNTPVDIENYALGAQCTEGIGANQMNHQACTVTYLGVAVGVSSFRVDRSILNNSGDIINIEEMGIYIYTHRVGAVLIKVMALRDLISQVVPDGGGITGTYTIRIAA